MNLQQYRFKFLTLSKNLVIAILVIGFLFSVRTILDFNKARRIETMNGPEFRQLVEDFNYQRASLRSLQAIGHKALNIVPQEIEASKQATLTILQKGKQCLDCQSRLVFFDVIDDDHLSQSGLDALHKSYELSPYGEVELMKWRLEVASKYWNELDEDLRRYSLTQITALSQYQTGRYWLRSFETEVESIKNRVSRITN